MLMALSTENSPALAPVKVTAEIVRSAKPALVTVSGISGPFMFTRTGVRTMVPVGTPIFGLP